MRFFNNIIVCLIYYSKLSKSCFALYKEYKLIHYLLFIILLFLINYVFNYIIFIFKK